MLVYQRVMIFEFTIKMHGACFPWKKNVRQTYVFFAPKNTKNRGNRGQITMAELGN